MMKNDEQIEEFKISFYTFFLKRKTTKNSERTA